MTSEIIEAGLSRLEEAITLLSASDQPITPPNTRRSSAR
jgi:hypothetical protein